MTKEEREAFELAAEKAEFRCDRINGQYLLLTRQAQEVWQAAIAWAEDKGERKSTAALQGWNKFYRGMTQRPRPWWWKITRRPRCRCDLCTRNGQLQERPGV